MLRVARTMAGLTALALLLACGSDSTAPSQDELVSVDVQPRDATLRLFALWPHMHQHAVSRAGLEIKTAGVWSSSDASIVSVDRGTGAMTGVAVGSATITDAVTVNGVTKSGTSARGRGCDSPLRRRHRDDCGGLHAAAHDDHARRRDRHRHVDVSGGAAHRHLGLAAAGRGGRRHRRLIEHVGRARLQRCGHLRVSLHDSQRDDGESPRSVARRGDAARARRG